MHDFCEFNHGKRILRCRLHDNCATNCKCGCDLSCHVDNGEVVGRDTCNDTDWLALNNATDETTSGKRSRLHCRRRESDIKAARCALGVTLKAFDGDRYLHARTDHCGGTSFANDQRDEVALAFAQGVGEGLQKSSALSRGSTPPFGESVLGGLGSGFGLSN